MVHGQTATLIDHILPNSSNKNISQSGNIDLGLSYSDLIYCTSLPKSHWHNETFVQSMKRYFTEKTFEKTIFPNYLTYAFVNDVTQISSIDLQEQ